MVLGENNAGGPSTTANAATYRSSHNYSGAVKVVNDPKWQKLGTAITHGNSGTIGLPFFVILDAEMKLIQVQAEVNGITQFLGQATGAQFDLSQAGSCEGLCGGQAGACYCDTECLQYGDCCADACDLCGSCP